MRNAMTGHDSLTPDMEVSAIKQAEKERSGLLADLPDTLTEQELVEATDWYRTLNLRCPKCSRWGCGCSQQLEEL
jgi:hypothetical protein